MLQGSVFVKSVLVYLACVSLFASSAHAQVQEQYQPRITYAPCSSYREGKGLYIVGGRVQEANATFTSPLQNFMIDLSVSWNTSAPAYRGFHDFGEICYLQPASLTSDGQQFVVITKNEILAFNYQSMEWGKNGALPFVGRPGSLAAVTDPDTGIIYIPFGYQPTQSPNDYFMLMTNGIDGSSMSDGRNVSSAKFPDEYSMTQYAVAWSKYLKGLVYSTGDGLYTYNLTHGWDNIMPYTTGSRPSKRYYPCLLSAYEGTKLVLFGGRVGIIPSQSYRDIYILDLTTMVWTLGPIVPENDGRYSAACGISNEQLVVWGGLRVTLGSSSIPNNPVIVYDLRANRWTTSYTAISNSTGTPTSTPPPETDTSSGKSNIGVIVGVVVAVLVVLALVCGYIYVRRKRSAGLEKGGDKDAGVKDMFTKETLDHHTWKAAETGEEEDKATQEYRYSRISSTVASSEPGSENTMFGPVGTVQSIYGGYVPSQNPHEPGPGSPVEEESATDLNGKRRSRNPHQVLDIRSGKVEVKDSPPQATAI
ncbi:hypothetical protein B0O80DRAFT_440519 [Mortierella sp. GBAus27b]|nr:hypothetical protein B0O80DRAFT_440519 [Mortierella sp. GBAus27b]